MASNGISTIPEDPASVWDKREKRLHLIAFGFVGLVVILALTGLLGVRTTTADASAHGYSLEVLHAMVSRGGLSTPFNVTAIAEVGSLPESVTIKVDSGYLDMFDENGLDPQPTSAFNDSEWTSWTFEIPDGSSKLQVNFDARLGPATQWGEAASAVLVIDGREMVTVDFVTWVMP